MAHSVERAHDLDIDANGLLRTKNTAQHSYTVLGKGVWKFTSTHFNGIGYRKMRLPIFELIFIQLEHKVLWETLYITFHLFIKTSGLYSIQPSQVTIKHNLLATDNVDEVLDILQRL